MYRDVKILNRFSRKIIDGHINVGLGEIAIGESDLSLRVPALGSCIALVIYIQDQPKEARIATMAHIVYPTSKYPVNPQKKIISWGKYADIAISSMISILNRKGFSKKRMVAKMTGGLEGLNKDFIPWNTNAPAIIKLLEQEKIRLKSSHTGGSAPIEAIFKVSDYKLYVTPKGAPTIIL